MTPRHRDLLALAGVAFVFAGAVVLLYTLARESLGAALLLAGALILAAVYAMVPDAPEASESNNESGGNP